MTPRQAFIQDRPKVVLVRSPESGSLKRVTVIGSARLVPVVWSYTEGPTSKK